MSSANRKFTTVFRPGRQYELDFGLFGVPFLDGKKLKITSPSIIGLIQTRVLPYETYFGGILYGWVHDKSCKEFATSSSDRMENVSAYREVVAIRLIYQLMVLMRGTLVLADKADSRHWLMEHGGEECIGRLVKLLECIEKMQSEKVRQLLKEIAAYEFGADRFAEFNEFMPFLEVIVEDNEDEMREYEKRIEQRLSLVV